MSDWPKWDYRVSPGGLADYVQPRLVRKALGRAAGTLPGPDSEADRLGQVKDIYAVFQRRRIRYVEAPFTSGDGGQDIRTPGEVLGRGGSGTCLDLAVVFAAACLHAGLKPVVVVLAAVEDNQADHAVVLVWLDPAGERYPLDAPYYANYHHPGRLSRSAVPDGRPPELEGAIRGTADGTQGSFLAVDIALAARQDVAAPDVSFEEAVTEGGRAVDDALGEQHQWRWLLGVNLDRAWHKDRLHTPPVVLTNNIPALLALVVLILALIGVLLLRVVSAGSTTTQATSGTGTPSSVPTSALDSCGSTGLAGWRLRTSIPPALARDGALIYHVGSEDTPSKGGPVQAHHGAWIQQAVLATQPYIRDVSAIIGVAKTTFPPIPITFELRSADGRKVLRKATVPLTEKENNRELFAHFSPAVAVPVGRYVLLRVTDEAPAGPSADADQVGIYVHDRGGDQVVVAPITGCAGDVNPVDPVPSPLYGDRLLSGSVVGGTSP